MWSTAMDILHNDCFESDSNFVIVPRDIVWNEK